MIDTTSKLTLESTTVQPDDPTDRPARVQAGVETQVGAGVEAQVEVEIEWMRAAAAGDRAAFGRVIDRHKHALVSYLARLAGSAEQAEDLAQETFLRLFQSLDSYRNQGKVKALLFRIATNLVRSQQRHRMRHLRLLPLLPAALRPAEPSQPDTECLDDEAQREVKRALNELPIDFRAVLILFEIEGHGHAEIAEMLGCRPGTVKSRLHRGRAALRAKLEGYWRHRSPGSSP